MHKRFTALLSLFLVLSLFAGSAMAESDLLNEFGTFPIIKNGSDITITIGTPAIATVTDYDDNHLTNYWRERLASTSKCNCSTPTNTKRSCS